jgi:hypothetical protein
MRTPFRLLVALLLLGTLVIAVPTQAADWYSESKLTATDGATGDYFGTAVAVSGNRIVVGASGDDSRSGSVYVYEPDRSGGWSETKLTASDGAANDWLGSAVAVSGDRIVAGAYAPAAMAAVYVYEPDGAGGWSETKITASDGTFSDTDLFGVAVAVSGDRIVVGAPYDDPDYSGSVYVYEPDGLGGWSETKLTASDAPDSGDFFGYEVGVSGDRIVVGAPYHDPDWTGSVYVYEADGAGGWSETKLTASDGAAEDRFGWVAVSGDRIVVGAPWDDDNGSRSGSAYVYEADGAGGWSETKLTAGDGAENDEFGDEVALSDDHILVGAPGADRSGATYVYEPDGAGGWSETKLTASDGATGDTFGGAVAVFADRIVVGASGDDDNGDSSGSAYVYEPLPAGQIFVGTVDAARVAGPRWTSTEYVPEDSGPHEFVLDWTGKAMLRIDIREAGSGAWIGANTSQAIPKHLAVDLDAGVPYRVAVWSMSGAGDFTVAATPLAGGIIHGGVADADGFAGRRWSSVTYGPSISGPHEFVLDWTGEAMLRIDIREVATGAWVGANTGSAKPKHLMVDLDAGVDYRVAVWSMRGVGAFTVTATGP